MAQNLMVQEEGGPLPHLSPNRELSGTMQMTLYSEQPGKNRKPSKELHEGTLN